MGQVNNAFRLDPLVFEKQFQFKKPGNDEEFIVYCRSGARSGMASDVLTKLGYRKYSC